MPTVVVAGRPATVEKTMAMCGLAWVERVEYDLLAGVAVGGMRKVVIGLLGLLPTMLVVAIRLLVVRLLHRCSRKKKLVALLPRRGLSDRP